MACICSAYTPHAPHDTRTARTVDLGVRGASPHRKTYILVFYSSSSSVYPWDQGRILFMLHNANIVIQGSQV